MAIEIDIYSGFSHEKHGDFPVRYVKLPEGISFDHGFWTISHDGSTYGIYANIKGVY